MLDHDHPQSAKEREFVLISVCRTRLLLNYMTPSYNVVLHFTDSVLYLCFLGISDLLFMNTGITYQNQPCARHNRYWCVSNHFVALVPLQNHSRAHGSKRSHIHIKRISLSWLSYCKRITTTTIYNIPNTPASSRIGRGCFLWFQSKILNLHSDTFPNEVGFMLE